MLMKLYLYKNTWDTEDDLPNITKHEYGVNDPTVINLGSVDIAIDIPTLTAMQVTQQQISKLVGLKEKVQADAVVRVEQIDDDIQKLMCLPSAEIFIPTDDDIPF